MLNGHIGIFGTSSLNRYATINSSRSRTTTQGNITAGRNGHVFSNLTNDSNSGGSVISDGVDSSSHSLIVYTIDGSSNDRFLNNSELARIDLSIQHIAISQVAGQTSLLVEDTTSQGNIAGSITIDQDQVGLRSTGGEITTRDLDMTNALLILAIGDIGSVLNSGIEGTILDVQIMPVQHVDIEGVRVRTTLNGDITQLIILDAVLTASEGTAIDSQVAVISASFLTLGVIPAVLHQSRVTTSRANGDTRVISTLSTNSHGTMVHQGVVAGMSTIIGHTSILATADRTTQNGQSTIVGQSSLIGLGVIDSTSTRDGHSTIVHQSLFTSNVLNRTAIQGQIQSLAGRNSDGGLSNLLRDSQLNSLVVGQDVIHGLIDSTIVDGSTLRGELSDIAGIIDEAL